MKVTVIGGGNMGGALAKHWSEAYEVTVADRSESLLEKIKSEHPNIKTSTNNIEAIKGADVIAIVVKPWIMEIVLKEITSYIVPSKQIICSVAAGVTSGQVNEILSAGGCGGAPVCYCIPNIAAEFGQSMSFISTGKYVTPEQKETIVSMFKNVGAVKVVSEDLVASGMMMASCGIAYVMRFIRAMTEGGIEMGFFSGDAKDIAIQTMRGAIALLSETGMHPEEAIDKVTTPGGVTIKGLNELDHAGFNSAVIRCLKAGLNK